MSHVLGSPFILIGTLEEIVDQIQQNEVRWGLTSYVVRQQSIADIGRVGVALRDT